MFNIRTIVALPCTALAALLTGCATAPQSFPSPEDATSALVAALQPYDRERLSAILGPAGDEVIASGDPVADQEDFDRFIAAYRLRHRFESGPDDTTMVVVGDQDWPMPIPIVRAGSGYRFDAARGSEEILNRRIGGNELDTIETCRAIVDAQQEYLASTAATESGAKPAYATKFLSDAGKHNGLYWPTEPGKPESPLGPLVAEAAAEGYGRERPEGSPRPYRGYCYRLLTAQGPYSPGGARSYLDKAGRLTDGFALVAFPVDHDNSGVMTFIVSHHGIVYQRDLGDDTQARATALTTFDPGPEWIVVP